MTSASVSGKVYLVGAGPGDPDLLTLRAARLLETADVVVYDHLVSKPIMDLIAPGALRICVGKHRNNHTLPQEEINRLLVRLASEHQHVVRLKGGDPFIFGRGGEELQSLAASAVAFEVVPGVTAASGVSSYTGIPLTHRDYAQSCTFVTGHLEDGSTNLDFEGLVRPHQTVVIYMGLGGLAKISQEMMRYGASPDLSVAVVQDGTMATQSVVIGKLADIAQRVVQAGLKSPCLIIVGEVVRLHPELRWFSNAPRKRF
jgi:uroporphyrin-III C-methyltransferase/precorrin-2 dehydrogenase/sirohydrochlorin ferrochelatase